MVHRKVRCPLSRHTDSIQTYIEAVKAHSTSGMETQCAPITCKINFNSMNNNIDKCVSLKVLAILY